MAQATTLLDLNGRPAFTIFKEQRIEIPLAKVSPYPAERSSRSKTSASTSTAASTRSGSSDRALANLRAGPPGAGSQHAHAAARATEFSDPRQDLPPQVPGDRSSPRELEREYSKNEILELYLNKVYFGDGLYGIEAAALGYFGKHASDLDARRSGAAGGSGEVALELRADRQPRSRAGTPGRRAAGDGGFRRDRRAAQPRRQRPSAVALKDALQRDEPNGAWFKEEVRRQLVARFGSERVYQGGLKVYTTIDPADAAGGRASRRRRARRDRRASRAAQGHEEGEPPPRARSAPGRARRDRRGDGRSARARGRPGLRGEPLQSRRAGQTATGIGLQAVRVCRLRSRTDGGRRRSSIISTSPSRRSRATGFPRTSTPTRPR